MGARGAGGDQKKLKSVTYCLNGPFNVKIDFLQKIFAIFSSVLTGQLSSVTYQELSNDFDCISRYDDFLSVQSLNKTWMMQKCLQCTRD